MRTEKIILRNVPEVEKGIKKPPFTDNEPDSMELEIRRSKSGFLNAEKSIFDRKDTGLNRTRSVFDETAVFHTGR